jgi:3-oxoacyl-[acyl-carrier protein] reductase
MRVHDGKVAIVIGGTRGIGAAISRRLAADGASVGTTFLSRSDDAERLSIELRSAGHHVLPVQADVSDAGALNDAIDQIVKHFGRLDILVSVAGTAIVDRLRLMQTMRSTALLRSTSGPHFLRRRRLQV